MKGCVKMADENQKKSFIVYFDWGEALSYFSNEEVGEIFRAVFSYAKDGTEPEFSQNTLNGVFTFMKSALDRDREAYEAKCKTNQINGRKGGRPKKTDGIKENPEKPNGYFEKPKKPDNDNNNDNDNENDNGIEKDNEYDNDNEFFYEGISSKKEKFGTFQNVFLTLEEYNELIRKFPDTYQTLVDKFSAGLKAKNYEYDDHYAGILLWEANEPKKTSGAYQKEQTDSTGNPFRDAKRNLRCINV